MKKIIGIFLIAAMLATGICTGCTRKSDKYDVEDGCELLFSFESYDNIHNTVKEMGNRLGRITLSDEHVTHGDKSMKVEVHGDYAPTHKPYMKIFCSESEFLNGDFSWFDSLKLDIFNANPEDLHIALNLNVYTVLDDTLSVNTEYRKFTLKANSMNVIEYEIPAIESMCNINNINYICLEFEEKKENKNDPMNVFYIDNLRGVLASERKQVGSGDSVSVEEGLGFEDFLDSMLVNPFDGMELSRKSYADAHVGYATEDEEFGDWLLCGTNPSKGNWPSVIMNFGKVYEAGTQVSFWLYVDIDSFASTASKTYIIEAFANTGKEGGPHTVEYERSYNEWHKVTVTFNTRSPQLYMFINMSDVNTGAQLVTGEYAFYFDNILLAPSVSAE